MLFERIAIALLLIPFGFWVIGAGGWFFTLTIAAILALASYEFAMLFQRQGYRPATYLLVLSSIGFVIARHLKGFDADPFILAFFVLASMTWHAIDFERGAVQSGTDFALTIGGFLYIGWMGAYFISLRRLPDGLWWFLTALPAVWIADSAAYSFGKQFGKHRLAPRLSPKKSWEGYLAGVVAGPLLALGFLRLWQIGAGPDSTLTLLKGAILGLVVAILAPIGDLGISMLKRQFGVKDTGTLLPGHGGALDRIDSWIWAAILGYFLVIGLS